LLYETRRSWERWVKGVVAVGSAGNKTLNLPFRQRMVKKAIAGDIISAYGEHELNTNDMLGYLFRWMESKRKSWFPCLIIDTVLFF